MAEYIEREALLELKEEMWQDRCDHMVVRVTNIMNVPAVDVVPVVHGRWDDDHKCTVCRKEALCEEKPDPYAHGLLPVFYVDSNYCPNCGAKMDLEG